MKASEMIQYRKDNGLTQYTLADKLHVGRGAVAHWEKGRVDIPDSIAAKLQKPSAPKAEAAKPPAQRTPRKAAPKPPPKQEAASLLTNRPPVEDVVTPIATAIADVVHKKTFEQRLAELGLSTLIDNFLLEMSSIVTQSLKRAMQGG